MVFDSLLNPVFSPLLILPYWLGIIILAFLISLLVVVIYKKFTDQTMMKSLKEQLKQYQTEIKSNKSNPSKALQLQKQAMEVNMKYMMQSMKPTLITFLPIIIIFGWLNTHIAFMPLVAGQQFEVEAILNAMPLNAQNLVVQLEVPAAMKLLSSQNQSPTLKNEKELVVSYNLSSDAGTYALIFTVMDSTNNVTSAPNKDIYTKDVLIVNRSSQKNYLPPVSTYKDRQIKSVIVKNQPVKPLGTISLFGWQPGWLGVYIISSILFSILLRKLFKVY